MVSDSAFLRLRDLPGGENIVAYIENGAPVTVYETATDKIGREWHHVLFEQNVPHLFQDEALTQPFTNYVRGYVYGPFVKFPGAHPDPVFTVDRTAITAGESVTLAWNAPGAAALRVNGKGVTGPANTLVSTPAKTMTYTFVASYDGEPDVTIAATVTVNPAPVPDRPPVRMGVNVVYDGPAMNDAVHAGTQVLCATFNPTAARVAKQANPALIVSARPELYKGYAPTIDYWWTRVEDAACDGMIFTGLNEGDQLDQKDPAAIRYRISYDRAALERTKAEAGRRGIHLIYAGGGFSVGEPDITNPAIVEALSGYADLIADPCFRFNQHLYASSDGRKGQTPEQIRDIAFDASYIDFPSRRYNPATKTWSDFTERIYQTDWTVTRYRFYQRRLGFKAPWPWLVCDEHGLDIGSIGGIAAMAQRGCDDAWLARWIKRVTWLFEQPTYIDASTSVDSPVEWAAIFQCGPAQSWAGYDVRGRLPVLQAAGWGH